MERKLTFIILALLFIACNSECEKIISGTLAGEHVVHIYPDCSDTTEYIRKYFYENGQLGSSGMVKNGLKEGLYKSWNEIGVQTAEWTMKAGKGHGSVTCWYDSGVKSKETIVAEDKENGLEKTWFEDGKLESVGKYSNGERIGTWRFFEEDGSWMIRNYKSGKLDGITIEHINDSLKEVIVIGQYEDSLETGIWKWFSEDSILVRTATYIEGKATGEYFEYHPNGKTKLSGFLVDGKYEGILNHYDSLGQLTKTVEYSDGEVINN